MMTDLENTVLEEQENTDYIEIINDLKNNTVPKDQYNRLKEENKKLMKSLANGETIAVEAPNKPNINELRKDLFSADSEHTNLDFISKSLELRNALIENGEGDPFIAQGRRIAPEDSDIATANRVADILQECVDYANGDSAAFTNELQRRMIDTAPITRRR